MTDEIDAEVMNLWRKYIPLYATDQTIALFFKPFEKIETVTGLTGISEGVKQVTNCHKYPISVMTSAGKSVDRLTISEYDKRKNHPNKGPSADYPMCKFVGNNIYVAPNTDVVVTYISVPDKAIYAFTLTGDDYVYDDNNSVDIELDRLYHDDVVNRVLANIGINMRDMQAIQYANNEQAKEGR